VAAQELVDPSGGGVVRCVAEAPLGGSALCFQQPIIKRLTTFKKKSLSYPGPTCLPLILCWWYVILVAVSFLT